MHYTLSGGGGGAAAGRLGRHNITIIYRGVIRRCTDNAVAVIDVNAAEKHNIQDRKSKNNNNNK